ncbi:hypothetical protein H7673_11090 [Streptococcus dysgalactiae subsp. equisimilis]|nr:hypothetical protein [Streptococcus dysgalactiae subsp. equisimilis]
MQCTRMDRGSSKSLANNSGILQGAALHPYLFSTYIRVFTTTFPANLFKYADDVVLCENFSNTSDLTRFTENLLSIQRFSDHHGLTLNPSNCVECVYSLSRSSFPTDLVVINGES